MTASLATPPPLQGWNLDHSYARLPEALFSREQPASCATPQLLLLNTALAADLGLDFSGTDDGLLAAQLSGTVLPPGAQPIAQAYAGHQFGHFTMLGDGRALLLGEQITPDGRRVDVQLKGSGPTVFSRRGDGRAALAPMLREYLISEAMHALGIPTTRSLAVVASGDPVWREAAKPGAVLVRVAASHVRVGTLEFAAAYGQQTQAPELLRTLADYVIERHYPQVREHANPYLALLNAVVERQAALVARWQGVGFVHGVLNTDNVALSGETIDYGPCAFMDAYDPATVFSSIDHHGRYAYGNQPRITGWNLARCAGALLPLLAVDSDEALALAQSVIAGFDAVFEQAWLDVMRDKLGIARAEPDDRVLIDALLAAMQQHGADFSQAFRRLSHPEPERVRDDTPGTEAFFGSPEFTAWHSRWRRRLPESGDAMSAVWDAMRAVNPAVIPRNHQVEAALAAAEAGDLAPFKRLAQVLAEPFVETDGNHDYRQPAAAGPYRTFCGT